MEITLGTLTSKQGLEHSELLSSATAAMIATLVDGKDIGVVEIDPQFSDTASFCNEYKVGPEASANCVIIEAKRGEVRQLVACVVLANTRADINGLVRKTLDARRASFAPMEEAVRETGMEFGAITPIGLPSNWTILIDSKVIEADCVIIGSGIRKSKILISGKLLATIPNVRVLEGLGQAR